MADPVAWLVIEEGWQVVGPAAEELGSVKEVLGDDASAIFDGLVVARGVLKDDRYLPAERVTGIYEGRVEVDLDGDALDALDLAAPGSGR